MILKPSADLKNYFKSAEGLPLRRVLCFPLKVPPQQLPMPLTLLYNLKPIIAHEINQPLAGNILKIMRPRDPEPAAADPSADGFMLVAEDAFHILGRDGIGQVIPFIVEPGAKIIGHLLGMEVELIRLIGLVWFPYPRILCGKSDGYEIFLGVRGAVFYVLVQIASRDDVSMRLLAGVLAGNHAVLEHPRALAFADM